MTTVDQELRAAREALKAAQIHIRSAYSTAKYELHDPDLERRCARAIHDLTDTFHVLDPGVPARALPQLQCVPVLAQDEIPAPLHH